MPILINVFLDKNKNQSLFSYDDVCVLRLSSSPESSGFQIWKVVSNYLQNYTKLCKTTGKLGTVTDYRWKKL
jgi:hypothetical protein